MAMSTPLFAGETNFVESRGNKLTNHSELSEGARYLPLLTKFECLLIKYFSFIQFYWNKGISKHMTNCSRFLKKQISWDAWSSTTPDKLSITTPTPPQKMSFSLWKPTFKDKWQLNDLNQSSFPKKQIKTMWKKKINTDRRNGLIKIVDSKKKIKN